MSSIDVKIYLNNFISFFEKNPESLQKLIGDIDKKLFFLKVEEKCLENLKNNEDVSLTNKQLENIIVNLWRSNSTVSNFDGKFVKTQFGYFSLN